MLGPTEYQRIHQCGAGLTVLGTVLRTASAASWVIVAISQATHRPVLPPLVRECLAPILPLSQHITSYYTFVPLIGLAWLAGDALASVRSRLGRSVRFSNTCCQIPSTFFVRDWYRDRSSEVEQREMRLAHAVQQIRTAVQPNGPTFLDRIATTTNFGGACVSANLFGAASRVCTFCRMPRHMASPFRRERGVQTQISNKDGAPSTTFPRRPTSRATRARSRKID